MQHIQNGVVDKIRNLLRSFQFFDISEEQPENEDDDVTEDDEDDDINGDDDDDVKGDDIKGISEEEDEADLDEAMHAEL